MPAIRLLFYAVSLLSTIHLDRGCVYKARIKGARVRARYFGPCCIPPINPLPILFGRHAIFFISVRGFYLLSVCGFIFLPERTCN